MAFPTSPTNGQTATVNNIAYVYASSTNTWTRQLGLFGNISTPLQAVIANATASTSTATGALIVTGGAGITGNTFVGNIISTGFYFANGAPFTSSSYGNTTVGQYLLTDSTVYGIQANIGAYQTYANTKIGTNTNSNLVVVATTTSTSTTTGAFVVKGGVGVAGDTYTGGNLTVGAYSSNTRANLFVYTGVLGTASGASIVMAELNNNNGNQSFLRFITNRVAAGSNWTTSSTKIQQRIDVTDQGYIEFNPLGSNYGVDIGNGSSPTIRAFENGNVVLPNTTASTTTATGALVVKGGVGVAGNVTAANVVITTGITYANGAAFSSGGTSGLLENLKTASYTLALADAGKVVAFDTATDCTVTVPSDATVSFPTGSLVYIFRANTGNVTLANAAGVSLTKTGKFGTYEQIYLRKRAANVWVTVEESGISNGSFSNVNTNGSTTINGIYTIQTWTGSSGNFTISG
jgi:hypothetical protein